MFHRFKQIRLFSSTNSKKRVLSGVQPTGTLHIGNYLGAIRQWVVNQDLYENYFCVVDLHAITVPHDPKRLKKESLEAAAMYLACGIDPLKSKVFIQSHVRAHAELAWLLNCITPIGWLERMVQFKEKGKKQGENTNMGLFGYPVLMAADILLYQADLVPVGEDQKQHLELTRDIYRRFNHLFNPSENSSSPTHSIFREPSPLILDTSSRVMSLTDGNSKMSKSAELDSSRINLLDSPDLISKKIKRCKTDQMEGLEWDNPLRPECTNLLGIYQHMSSDLGGVGGGGVGAEGAGSRVGGLKTKEEVLREVSGLRWGQFKSLLSEVIIAHLQPIQARYTLIQEDHTHLLKVLREGQEGAEEVADRTLGLVREAMGFHPPITLSPPSMSPPHSTSSSSSHSSSH